MIRTIYEVHSDVDENTVYMSFMGKGAKQKAISYAKRHISDQTWVDKVRYDDRIEDYEYVGAAWSYDWKN